MLRSKSTIMLVDEMGDEMGDDTCVANFENAHVTNFLRDISNIVCSCSDYIWVLRVHTSVHLKHRVHSEKHYVRLIHKINFVGRKRGCDTFRRYLRFTQTDSRT